jgi:hypothetical protein
MKHRIFPLVVVFLLAFAAKYTLVASYSGNRSLSWDDYENIAIAKALYDGRGFETDVIFPLIGLPSYFPMAYHHQQPLYLLAVAAFFHVFGPGILSAQIVNILSESLICAVVYALALELTGSAQIASYSSILYFISPFSVLLSESIMTDSLFSLLAGLVFLLFLRPGMRHQKTLIGAILGLAYLTRVHGLLLLPVIFHNMVRGEGFRRGLKSTLMIAALAALVSSPWLYWNIRTVGDPFYTVAAYGVLAPVDELTTGHFTSIRPAKGMLDVLAENINPNTPRVVFANLLFLARNSLYLFPSFFGLFAVVGCLAVARHVQKSQSFYASVLIFFCLTIGFSAVSYPLIRYGEVFTQFACILSAVGMSSILPNNRTLRLLSVAILVASTGYLGLTHPIRSGVVPTNVAYYLLENADHDAVVMADFPYYINYLSGLRCVQTPSDKREAAQLIGQYGVKYLVVSDPQFSQSISVKTGLLTTIDDYRIYWVGDPEAKDDNSSPISHSSPPSPDPDS